MEISAISAYYVHEKWGEGGFVCARWQESPEALAGRSTHHQVGIPIVGGVLHYEDLLAYPLVVIEMIFHVLGATHDLANDV